jgi:hypothetical protein
MNYQARLEQATDYLVAHLKLRAPKETWNLTNNGIRKAWNPSASTWEIVIGGEPAPYAVYTNEPWISEKWHGAINPHQGWIQMAVEEAKPMLIAIMSGAISQEEYWALMGQTENAISELSTKMAGEIQ